MKIVVMYHNNFLENIKDKQKRIYMDNLEEVVKHINQDTRLKKMVVFTFANLMYCQKALASPSMSVAKIDKAGSTILGICRTIGYWACLISCICEIIKSLMQGDTKSIAKIMMKYALAFAALYFFPWLLDIIKDIFA